MWVFTWARVCVRLFIWGLEGREGLKGSTPSDFLGRADLKAGLWNTVDIIRDYGDF